MTYEVYHYLSIGAAVACGLMIALSVVLFFVLKIPKVISDLSGRTARRAIEDIRRQNETSGDKSHRSSFVNLHRGKVTDKISNSRRIQHPTPAGNATTKIATQNLRGKSRKMPGNTGKMPAQQPYAPRHVFQGEATTILPDMNATTILPENQTTTVLPENDVTTILPENQTTTVLPENDVTTILPENQTTTVLSENDVTTILPENQTTTVLPENDVTTILPENNVTTVLPENIPQAAPEAVPAAQDTAVLAPGNETTVLYAGNETSVLYAPQQQAPVNPAAVFSVDKEITYVHTQEMIPVEAVYGR